MIQAVVFDFGGVFASGDGSRSRLREFDALLGWPPDTMQYRLFAGEVWELASTGMISPEEHWARTAADVEDLLPADFRRFKGDPFYLDEMNGDVVALAEHVAQHYRLALCSNALPSLAGQLDAMLEFKALFDVVVISALVGLRKPDPRIYQLTAEWLDLPLSACLLVDDKERNVGAAEAAGMPAHLFRSAERLEASLHALLEDDGSIL
jgi:putative hydrolase of the HAD superfamily